MAQRIHGWLERHAREQPNQLAVEFLDESLTYAQLDARANQLAHALLANGAKSGDRIGLFMDKSIYTPVAIYGVMKAGCAYVPLDPAYGAERLGSLIDRAQIDIVISARAKRRTLATLATMGRAPRALFGVDQPALSERCVSWTAVAEQPATSPDISIEPDALAYIIFTSGSTGTPKGIMHTHASGLAFARWAAEEYALTPADRLSNHAPLHFDLSIFDFFAGVVAGATTVIVPEDYARLPASYAQLIHEAGVSVLFTVPFALIQLVLRGAIERFSFDQVRWVIFGGEPFPPAHLCALMARWPHAAFDNMYGPAEVNGVTHHTVSPEHDANDAVPIGRVARGAHGVIVDEQGSEVPAGDVGELLIASPTMMRGYWRAPELDAQVFDDRRSQQGAVTRYYRTGDLVRADADGCLHFIGRADRQVKVRGYRVELDEIELAVTGYPAVEESAAYVIQDAEGGATVQVEVTLQRDTVGAREALLNDITRYVKTRLAWYAVPARIDITKQFPRTTSGKIDRRTLAETAAARQHQQQHPDSAAPRSSETPEPPP
ncbi:MAG: amino acid adenylation domain-containing protein [Pseudomonadota bacterium]